jgi:hypothetical protein
MSASPRQVSYIEDLLVQREVDDVRKDAIRATIADMTPTQISNIIDALNLLPRKPVAQLPALEAGKVYVSGDVVIRVQKNRQSGRSYALVLDNESGRFEYDGNAYRAYAATAEPISFERAAELGMRHNRCIHCSRDLTAEDSVLLAIGPVCAQKHHGVSQSDLVARMRAIQGELSAA